MSSMHDQLTCSICLELYDKPVRLACFHVFCQRCIMGNLNIPHRSLMCPECNGPIEDSGQISSFKIDFKLASLVQTIKEMPKCTEHNDGVDTLEECKADVMCRTCCTLLCVKCAFSEKHKNHDMEELKSAIAKQKDALSKRIPLVKRKIEECNEQLCNTKKARTEIDVFQSDFLSNFNLMIDKFKSCLQELKRSGECAVEHQAKYLCKLYKEKQYTLEQKVKYGESLLKRLDHVEKDPVRCIQILKEDATMGNYFNNSFLPEIPMKATAADVFKRCPKIEKKCLQLQKLVNGYLEKIRNGELEDLESPLSLSQIPIPQFHFPHKGNSKRKKSRNKMDFWESIRNFEETSDSVKPTASVRSSTATEADF